jgi:phosphoglycerol transferase MdoB-like AlkP superfamily enzyme
MIAGLSIENFTILHVVISLIAIVSGLIVLVGMLGSRRLPGWTALFLATTVLTSVTGFMFPISGLTPGIVFGLISVVVLAIALIALYVKQLGGAWRWIYVTTALIALYLNVFVLIVQLFQKVPALQKLAPTQSELPFSVTQGVILVAFLVLGTMAARKFRPAV